MRKRQPESGESFNAFLARNGNTPLGPSSRPNRCFWAKPTSSALETLRCPVQFVTGLVVHLVQRVSCHPSYNVPSLEVCVSQRISCCIGLILVFAAVSGAQETRLVLDRGGGTVVLEPYAPNIIRVTLSLLKQPALAPPGYGFTAAPAADGWSHEQNEQGDIYRSGRLSVTVATPKPGKPLPTQQDIAKFFNGSAPGTNITFNTADGTRLLDMQGWAMAVPNHKDGTAGVLNDKRRAMQRFTRWEPHSPRPRTSTITAWARTGRLSRPPRPYRRVLE